MRLQNRTALIVIAAMWLMACATEFGDVASRGDEDLELGQVESASCLTVAPTASAPSGNITNNRPVFSWTSVPGATSYTLYVLDPADNFVVHAVGITATSYQPPNALPANILLRWKVKGESSCGAGPYSPSIYFTVVPPSPAVPTSFYFTPSSWGAQANSFTTTQALDGAPHSLTEVNTLAVGCTNCTNTYLMRPVYEVGGLPAVSDTFTVKIVAKKRSTSGDPRYAIGLSTPSGQGAVFIDSPGYPCSINTVTYKTCYFYYSKSFAPDTAIRVSLSDLDNSATDTVPDTLDVDSIQIVRGRVLF